MRSVLAVAVAAILLGTPTAAWPRRDALRADVEGYAMASCLIRQDPAYLREQGHLWSGAVLQHGHGSLDDWSLLSRAVEAESARRPMAMARGDGAVHAPLKAMPLLFCHELVRTPVVRAAMARAVRRLTPSYR